MNKRIFYSLEERLRYHEERVKSLRAKLNSEIREQRSDERLEDMSRRLDEACKMLAELRRKDQG